MADYLYMLETRLTPEQQRGVSLVQDAARAHEMNVYLTGGTIRDIITGLAIRDLDFTMEGSPSKLEKDLTRAGATIDGFDDDLGILYLHLPGNVRAAINMARTETYPKPGHPVVKPGSIVDDLRRRDFTVNAMGLSLNEGSKGLLLDPANGVADIEAKLVRILHNYSFLEDPSRLIRATRFLARWHWQMEERTQARYAAAVENEYIDSISKHAVGYEIEQVAHEEDPMGVLKALEREGWLKVLNPHWSVAKVDTPGLSHLIKTRQQMQGIGYNPDMSAAVMYFLTHRLSAADQAAMQRIMPRKEFIHAWRHLEEDGKGLAKKLTGKESATPSRAWGVLSAARPETILYLATTTRNQSVTQKIRNFFTKWRDVKNKLPLPEMAEMRITAELPVYRKLMEDAFLLLLDGKLRSRTEIVKFLRPFEPPPPPPPPPAPVRRGRAAKAEVPAGPPPGGKPGVPAKKGKGVVAAAPAAAAPAPGKSKTETVAAKKPVPHPVKPAKAASKPAKNSPAKLAKRPKAKKK
jgi:tRNA nucleotidyltransferase (CCA-adding enzyme)